MTRLNNGLAVLLVALVAAVVALSVVPARAQDRSSTPAGNATPAPVLDDGGWITLGNWTVQWQPSTGLLRLLPLATPTPDAPSATPTATPTATPSATVTPTSTPTASATPSSTPGQGEPPTPTPETGTPIPDDGGPLKHCYVTIVADAPVNVRVWPEAGRTDNYAYADDGTRLRFMAGYRAEVVSIFDAPGERWGLTTFGWFALEYLGATYGQEVTPTPIDAVPCEDVPRSTYERTTLLGFHLIYTAHLSTTGPLYAALNGHAGLVKEAPLSGTMGIGPAIKDAGLADIGIARIAGIADCPGQWGQGDPEAVAEAWWLIQYHGIGGIRGLEDTRWADYVEYNNECLASVDIGWQARYYRRMTEKFNAVGMCTLSGSWYGGTPEPEQWADPRWQAFLDWLLLTPCKTLPDGTVIRNGIAMHNYPGANPVDLDNIWYYGRFRQFERIQAPVHQLVPLFFTEQGIYGEDRGTIPDCAHTANEHRRMIDGYRRHPWVQGVAIWSGGGGTEWVDITGQCGIELVAKLQ